MICHEKPLLKEWKRIEVLLSIAYILVLCWPEVRSKTSPKGRIFPWKFQEKSRKSEFSLENSKKNPGRANFRSKICVNYNNRLSENSANFLRTFAQQKNSPFFVEKSWNSWISSNYALITFAQYCKCPVFPQTINCHPVDLFWKLFLGGGAGGFFGGRRKTWARSGSVDHGG